MGCVGEDGRCRLYDKRCGGQISFYEKTSTSAGQTCSFSASGRLIFAGYESGAMKVYETNQSGGPTFSQRAKLHESNVQDSELSPCGCALATASWDHRRALQCRTLHLYFSRTAAQGKGWQ